tara:strand:+ start:526 stop:1938 length:1413 start_codon:yes stop_codon:yes gene_type:complete
MWNRLPALLLGAPTAGGPRRRPDQRAPGRDRAERQPASQAFDFAAWVREWARITAVTFMVGSPTRWPAGTPKLAISHEEWLGYNAQLYALLKQGRANLVRNCGVEKLRKSSQKRQAGEPDVTIQYECSRDGWMMMFDAWKHFQGRPPPRGPWDGASAAEEFAFKVILDTKRPPEDVLATDVWLRLEGTPEERLAQIQADPRAKQVLAPRTCAYPSCTVDGGTTNILLMFFKEGSGEPYTWEDLQRPLNREDAFYTRELIFTTDYLYIDPTRNAFGAVAEVSSLERAKHTYEAFGKNAVSIDWPWNEEMWEEADGRGYQTPLTGDAWGLGGSGRKGYLFLSIVCAGADARGGGLKVLDHVAELAALLDYKHVVMAALPHVVFYYYNNAMASFVDHTLRHIDVYDEDETDAPNLRASKAASDDAHATLQRMSLMLPAPQPMSAVEISNCQDRGARKAPRPSDSPRQLRPRAT